MIYDKNMDRLTCNANTKKGLKCKNRTNDGKYFCYIHFKTNAMTNEKTNALVIDKKTIEPLNAPITFNIFECKCCYDDESPVYKMISCSNGHDFCSDCISKYIVEKLQSDCGELVCIYDVKCKGTFEEQQLVSKVDNTLYKNYANSNILNSIKSANVENLFTCSKCTIYSVIIEPHLYDYIKNKMTCAMCNFDMCIRCLCAFHGESKCYDKSEPLENDDDDLHKTIENILTKHRIRHCPNCQETFIRSDGCNKMKCVKCSTCSCYICGKSIEDYKHFHDKVQIYEDTCPLWTDESIIVNRAVETAADEIYEKYLHNQLLTAKAIDILFKLI